MIQNALVHELNECCEVMTASYKEASTKAGFPNRGRVNFTYDELLSEVIKGSEVFIKKINSRVVGMIRIETTENNIWRIKDIAVLPEYQQNGYGRELLDFVKTKASVTGVEKLELGMFDDELILKRWYEKNGFTFVKTISFGDTSFFIRIMEYVTGRVSQ